jgi:hypothetical protein
MFMKETVTVSQGFDLRSTVIEKLRFVSGRQSIELLFNILQSSLSLRRRSSAAALLVHLALLEQVSIAEVQKRLTAAIEDSRSPRSHQFFDRKSPPNRVIDVLRTLLVRLLVKEVDNIDKPVKNIDMLNERLDNRIPAAVFEKFDN